MWYNIDYFVIDNDFQFTFSFDFRPLQGTVALLQNSYMPLLQQVIANGLPGQLLGSDISLQDLLLNLINTVDKEIQLLSNIQSTQQFDTHSRSLC